jgi:hypothetical protein
MSPEQFSELVTTLSCMRETAHVLSRSMEMFARTEPDAARHAYFSRLHVALGDCALALGHALKAAPTIVQK